VKLRRVQGLFTCVGFAEAAILPFLPIVLEHLGDDRAQYGRVIYDYAGPRALFLACAAAALVAATSVLAIAARSRATRVSPT
jgi:hypothetical protein